MPFDPMSGDSPRTWPMRAWLTGRFGALTTRWRSGSIRFERQRRKGEPHLGGATPTHTGRRLVARRCADDGGRGRARSRHTSTDPTAAAAATRAEPEPEQAPTPTLPPPSGPPVPAGEWWQDDSGQWQQGPRSTAPTRLDDIREQIDNLDGASKFLGRKEIKELPSILWEDERVERRRLPRHRPAMCSSSSSGSGACATPECSRPRSSSSRSSASSV